jgi:transposase
MQTMQPGMAVSAVVRLLGVSPSLLFQWRRRMSEGGHEAVRADQEFVPISRVRELERLLGCKTMATKILREALEQACPKKPTLRLPSPLPSALPGPTWPISSAAPSGRGVAPVAAPKTSPNSQPTKPLV